jgi:hypothetical protein
MHVQIFMIDFLNYKLHVIIICSYFLTYHYNMHQNC